MRLGKAYANFIIKATSVCFAVKSRKMFDNKKSAEQKTENFVKYWLQSAKT